MAFFPQVLRGEQRSAVEIHHLAVRFFRCVERQQESHACLVSLIEYPVKHTIVL